MRTSSKKTVLLAKQTWPAIPDGTVIKHCEFPVERNVVCRGMLGTESALFALCYRSSVSWTGDRYLFLVYLVRDEYDSGAGSSSR